MSEFNDFQPMDESNNPESENAVASNEAASILNAAIPNEVTSEPELFSSLLQRQPEASPRRIPNIGHLLLLLLYLLAAFFIAAFLSQMVLYFHLFGLNNTQKLLADFRFQLGLQVFAYLVAFLGCLQIMPILWHAPYFKVLSWRAYEIKRRIPLLIAAVLFCFTLAALDSVLFPQPKEAPIDQIFKAPGAPWLLFIFGTTIAPFFEEMAFRGFILPAFATAYDWCSEKLFDLTPHPLESDGSPQWSFPALVLSSLITSALFAWMHSAQNGGSMGSFVLLVGVSLILCTVRLVTRSLAASTCVHAAYNFTIFALMFSLTHGFQQMDKM